MDVFTKILTHLRVCARSNLLRVTEGIYFEQELIEKNGIEFRPDIFRSFYITRDD
jgi:hypothetical protein